MHGRILKDGLMDLRNELSEMDMIDPINAWVVLAPGEFSVYDVDRELEIQGQDNKRIRTIALERLVDEGILDRVGSKRGYYRPAIKDIEPLNIQSAG